MNDPSAKTNSALLFLDGDNFKFINDTWGHAAGDCVLIEVASRMMEFGDKRHQAYRLGGDEFAMVLYGVHSELEVQHICAALSQQFIRPFDLHNGQKASMSLSIGFALAWENASVEALLERADRNMYQEKPAYENNKLEGIHYVKTLLRADSSCLTGSGRLSVAAGR